MAISGTALPIRIIPQSLFPAPYIVFYFILPLVVPKVFSDIRGEVPSKRR